MKVVTPARKKALLATIAEVEGCTVEQGIAVGDGANDLPMLSAAGTGIAYHAKPRVQEQASARLNYNNLNAVCWLLNWS